MEHQEASPESTPRVTAAYGAMPFKKFAFHEGHSFYDEAQSSDADVVNFESDEEVAPYTDIPARQIATESTMVIAVPEFSEDADAKGDLPAYEKLSILERVTHSKWQVRLHAYQDIAECLETGTDLYSDKGVSVFEHYAGWLKEMATDKNLSAQMEGLKTMLVFVSRVADVAQTMFLVAVDLLDKCPITKQAYAAIILQILGRLLARDSDGLLLGELAKRVKGKRINEALLVLKAVTEHIPKALPTHAEKLLDAGRTALLHSHNEVRAMGQKLCTDLYKHSLVSKESLLKALKGVKPAIVKEVCEAFDAVPREEAKTEEAAAPGLLDFDYECVPAPAASDLRALLHPKFAETAYLTTVKLKQEVLAHLKRGLSAVSAVADTAENAQTLNLLLNYMDDSNVLVYTEVLQILELLVWKCPGMFTMRWRQLTSALCEKLKGSRKQAKAQVHRLLSSMCLQRVTGLQEMTEVLVELARTHRNPQVREDALAWVAMELERLETLLSQETDLLSGAQASRHPADAIAAAVSRKLLQISKKDVAAQVRDQAVRSLSVLLRLQAPGSEAQRALEDLVGKLHKVRVQELQRAPVRPSTAPGLDSVPLLDMDLPLQEVTEDPHKEAPLEVPAEEPVSECGSLSGFVRDLLEKRGSVLEFEALIASAGQETVTSSLPQVAADFIWVLQRCGSPERVSTVADACSYLSCLVQSLPACHPEDCMRLQTLVLFASSFSVCTQDLLSTLDTLFRISSKILFLRGLAKTVTALRAEPWTHVAAPQLANVVRFCTQWVEQASKQKTSVNYFQRAKPCELFQDAAYQQNYSENLLHEVEDFRATLSAVCGEGGLMKATGILRRLRQIEKMLKLEGAEARLGGLDEFLKFAQCMQAEGAPLSSRISARHRREASSGTESNPTTQRGHLPVIIVPLEELKRLLETVAAGMCVAKSAVESETYRAKALGVVRALRELISVQEAEELFPILAKSLPVLPFDDPFNSKAYFALSDWLAASPAVRSAQTLVGAESATVTIHLVCWLGTVELRSKDHSLEDLAPAAKVIVAGLNPDGMADEEHTKAYSAATETLIRMLMTKFGREATIKFFELQLVSCGRLFQEFAKWLDSQFPDRQPVSSVPSLDLSHIKPPTRSEDLAERLRVERFAHEQTQQLLEKLNGEYLTQVTANYELQEDLKACRAENTRLQLEVSALRAAVAQSEPWSRPVTSLEDLKPRDPEVASSRVDLFAPLPPAEAKFIDLAEDGSDTSLCVFQYLLISSTNAQKDLTLPLISTYESLDLSAKVRFLKYVSAAVSQEDVLRSISAGALKSLLQFNLRYLSAENREIEQTGPELQHLLGSLMDVKDRTTTFCSLLVVLADAVPDDYSAVLSKDHRSFLKVCLKCLLRVFRAMVRVSSTFSIWLELYRFFDRHPPEQLTSECPNLSDFEQVFKVLRGLSDELLAGSPVKAFTFLKFILATSKRAESNLYVRYLAGVLDKKHALSLRDAST